MFVAVPLAEPVQDELDRAIADKLGEEAVLPGRPVISRNRHLTLRFVGQCSDAQVGTLRESISSRTLGRRFEVSLGRLGAFPTSSRARVLWVGVEKGRIELQRLAAEVEAGTVAAGFAPDERPFQAHMTLSRLPDPADVRGLIEGADGIDVGFLVDQVVMFESHLSNGPPTYTPLATFDLEPALEGAS